MLSIFKRAQVEGRALRTRTSVKIARNSRIRSGIDGRAALPQMEIEGTGIHKGRVGGDIRLKIAGTAPRAEPQVVLARDERAFVRSLKIFCAGLQVNDVIAQPPRRRSRPHRECAAVGTAMRPAIAERVIEPFRGARTFRSAVGNAGRVD